MKLKSTILDNIIWPIVIFYLMQIYFISDEVFFILSLLVLFFLILKEKRIFIMKIPVFNLYLVVLIFMVILGLFKYSIRLVVRDVFYEFSNIVIIMIGYYLFKSIDKKKSIWKTTCFMVSITTIITLISGVFSMTQGVSFSILRMEFGTSIYSVEILLPLLLVYKIFYNKILFSKNIDLMIIFIWSIQILINMSRVSIVCVCTIFICSSLLMMLSNKFSKKALKKILSFFIIGMIVVSMFWTVIPVDIKNHFSNKFINTLNEINSNNSFTSNADAESNWRGYEIYASQQLWNKSTFITKIIGSGNGTLIPLEYIPEQWKNIMEFQNGLLGVTVLHNTFYTLLPKGGLIAVCIFLLYFLLNIVKGLKNIFKSNYDQSLDGIFLVGLCIGMLINSYVIRGMFQNDAQLSWALLFGWINAKLVRSESDRKL